MAQHSEWIPFHERLQQQIGSVLQGAGFKLDSSNIGQTESTLRYKRMPINSGQAQTIVFDGMLWTDFLEVEEHSFNWLRVYATSQDTTLVVKRISQNFSGNPQLAGNYDLEGWVYTDEAGRDAALDEIAEVVSTRLLKWFDSPSSDLTS